MITGFGDLGAEGRLDFFGPGGGAFRGTLGLKNPSALGIRSTRNITKIGETRMRNFEGPTLLLVTDCVDDASHGRDRRLGDKDALAPAAVHDDESVPCSRRRRRPGVNDRCSMTVVLAVSPVRVLEVSVGQKTRGGTRRFGCTEAFYHQ